MPHQKTTEQDPTEQDQIRHGATVGSRPSRTRRVLLPGVVLLVLLAVTVILYAAGRDGADEVPVGTVVGQEGDKGGADETRDGTTDDAPEEEIVPALESLARREQGDPMALGEVDAPVVMIAYSEFQCPFCGRFARETEPVLVEDYVEEGSLRIEWRDFPYLGQESRTAALAARAAGAQGAFWEFEAAMFADQQPPNSGRVTADFLADVAEGVGLDRRRFLEDLQSEEAAAAVDRDFQEGQSIGVTGTPAFLINGRPVMGAQPTDVFTEAVEEALVEAEGDR